MRIRSEVRLRSALVLTFLGILVWTPTNSADKAAGRTNPQAPSSARIRFQKPAHGKLSRANPFRQALKGSPPTKPDNDRQTPSGFIETVAGGGIGDDSPARTAFLNFPSGAVYDATGNIFLADTDNHRVRRIDAESRIITTVAGTGRQGFSGDGGPATAATLNAPTRITLDRDGNLFVADTGNYRVRRIDARTGAVSTVAGNGTPDFTADSVPATTAGMTPIGIAVDGSLNLFIADGENHRIRRVDPAVGNISTVAGTGREGFSGDGGPAAQAQFAFPADIALDSKGNLYVADSGNNRVRRIDATARTVTTVAGSDSEDLGDNGPAVEAGLFFPLGVAADAGDNLYIADTGNNLIRFVDAASKTIRTIAGDGFVDEDGNGHFTGDGGPANRAGLDFPVGLAVDAVQNVVIVDAANYRLRFVNANSLLIDTLAGIGSSNFSGDGGPAVKAGFSFPNGVAVDQAGNVFISDTFNHRVRRVDARTGVVTTFAGTGATMPDGSGTFGGDNGPAAGAGLNLPTGLAIDRGGNLFVADSGNDRVRRIDARTGVIVTVAGNGRTGFTGDGVSADQTALNFPLGVAVDSIGNFYIADTDNHRVRMVDASRVDAVTGVITTIAGNGREGFSGDGGPAVGASVWFPEALAFDSRGNLFISDSGFITTQDDEGFPGGVEVSIGNNRIRRVDAATKIISTVAGNGKFDFAGDNGPAVGAALWFPRGLALDAVGNLFFADGNNHRIRRYTPANSLVSTVGGSGRPGFSGDGGAALQANLRSPNGAAFDGFGNLYIADTDNGRIRRIVGIGAGQPVTTITNVVFAKPLLTISGSGFGTTGAKVRVNDTDVTSLVAEQSDATITLRGNKKKFALVKGANRVAVTTATGATATFSFNF